MQQSPPLQTFESTSSSSSTPTTTPTRAQRRGSRTTNACEACKKRKTKCSGPPGPCVACRKVDTYCHFNAKMDTRRKIAYKSGAVKERQQYILLGLLQTLKHNELDDVQDLVQMIRNDAPPRDLASCLKRNLEDLQGRGIIPCMEVDENDLVSLGLQGLFSHRSGKTMKFPDEKKAPEILVPASVSNSWPPCYSEEFAPQTSSRQALEINEDFHDFINEASRAPSTMPVPNRYMREEDGMSRSFWSSSRMGQELLSSRAVSAADRPMAQYVANHSEQGSNWDAESSSHSQPSSAVSSAPPQPWAFDNSMMTANPPFSMLERQIDGGPMMEIPTFSHGYPRARYG